MAGTRVPEEGPMRKPRKLLPHDGHRKRRSARQIAAAPPGFDYPITQAGVAGNVTVYYDPELGAQGSSLAQQLLGAVTQPYQDMQTWFGATGGVLYLDATFDSTGVDPLDLEVGLYVAELSECFMGTQGAGWGCGDSNGEGLSRFAAEQETPAGTMAAFATGPAWAQAGFPDWVDTTENTDQDAVSIGCSIVYLYWMVSQGYAIPQIVQAAGATLAGNYETLTGKTTAYQDLLAAVQNLTITSDDPFAG